MTNKQLCPLCSQGHLAETKWYQHNNYGDTLTWVSSMCDYCEVEQTSAEQMDYNKYLNIKHWRDFTYEQL